MVAGDELDLVPTLRQKWTQPSITWAIVTYRPQFDELRLPMTTEIELEPLGREDFDALLTSMMTDPVIIAGTHLVCHGTPR